MSSEREQAWPKSPFFDECEAAYARGFDEAKEMAAQAIRAAAKDDESPTSEVLIWAASRIRALERKP